MHEVRFIFLYHPVGAEFTFPGDPKQAAISGSRCFVILVIYGARFRPEDRTARRRLRMSAREGRRRETERISRTIRIESRQRGASSIICRVESVVRISCRLFLRRLVSKSRDTRRRRWRTRDGRRMAARLRPDVSSPGRVNPLWEKQRNELRCRP